MIIKSIELYNFRIYRGVNKIDLTPNGERNIIIVSGNNCLLYTSPSPRDS